MIWTNDDPDGTDTFRIKIWHEDGGSEVPVYDRGFDQPLGGGNVKIRTGNGSAGSFAIESSAAVISPFQADSLTLVGSETNNSTSLVGQTLFAELASSTSTSPDENTDNEPASGEPASSGGDSLEDLLSGFPLSVTARLLT